MLSNHVTLPLLFILTFTVMISTQLPSKARDLKNVFCGSYDDYVATDPGYHRYTPYFVKVKRCHGRNYAAYPRNMDCVPRNGTVKIIDFKGLDNFGQTRDLKIENHTDCIQKCVITQANCTDYEEFNEKECRCKCKVKNSQQGRKLCQSPLSWQQVGCNCVCPIKPETVNCGKKKVFDTTQCGCTCAPRVLKRCLRKKMLLDELSCTCIEPSLNVAKAQSDCKGGVNGAMLAVVIVVEAVVIIFCYFFFFRYCYKEVYLTRRNLKNTYQTTVENGNRHTDKAESMENKANGFLQHKEKMRKEEEEEARRRHNGISDKKLKQMDEESDNFSYHPDVETSPLAPNHYGNEYVYNNDMRPPSSLDNHNLNIPPDYSDIISDFSTEEGSVTQV